MIIFLHCYCLSQHLIRHFEPVYKVFGEEHSQTFYNNRLVCLHQITLGIQAYTCPSSNHQYLTAHISEINLCRDDGHSHPLLKC